MPTVTSRSKTLRIFTVTAYLCLLTDALIAHEHNAQDPSTQAQQTTPMNIAHGKPFVAVMVNGKGPFRFVVDTGTGGEAFITAELAHQLNLSPSGHISLSDPSGQNHESVPTALIDTLEVAGTTFPNIRAIIHPLSQSEGTCQGLLGFPLFRAYLLTLDFPQRRLTLATGKLSVPVQDSPAQSHPAPTETTLPYRSPDQIPIITLIIDHHQIEAQLDSGGAGLSLPEQFAATLNFASIPVAFSNANSLSTRFQIKAAKLLDDIHLGAYTFAHPFVEINPAFPLANFGSCPMQNFALTFDQIHHLVRFTSINRFLRLAPTPSPLHLSNSAQQPRDLNLVPVG